MNKYTYFFICSFFFFSVIYSQEVQVLTLEESLSIALKESYSIKAAEFNLISSRTSLEALKLGLRTAIDLEFDLPNFNGSLSSQFNSISGNEEFYKISSTKIEGRLALNQPIVFTNGTLSLVGTIFGRNQNSQITGDSRDYFSNLSVRLNQPLFSFNSLSASLERAEINLKKADRNFSITERNIIYNVKSSFYRLYQAKQRLKISEEKVKQSEEQYHTAVNKLKAGLIAEVEALQLEVDLASSKNDFLSSKSNFDEQLNSFKILIGIEIDNMIDIEANINYSPVIFDEMLLIENALKKRDELLNMEADLFLTELNIEEVDSRSSIKAQLNANYGINKSDELIDNIFSEFNDSRSVVFSVNIPVLDWGKNGREVEAAKASFDSHKAEYNNLKQQIKNELIASINRVKTTKARVETLSKSVEVAQKSYDISVQRFEVGKITSFDLSQVQLRLTDSKLNSLSAIVEYMTAIADLERKSLTILLK